MLSQLNVLVQSKASLTTAAAEDDRVVRLQPTDGAVTLTQFIANRLMPLWQHTFSRKVNSITTLKVTITIIIIII